MKLPTRGNARHGHWAQRKRLVDKQAGPVLLLLGQHQRPELPVSVRLTRVAPRLLDRKESEAMALKAVRDAVAKWLGADDNDPRIRWFYAQTKDPQCRPRYQAARVEIVPWHEDCGHCGQEFFPELAGLEAS